MVNRKGTKDSNGTDTNSSVGQTGVRPQRRRFIISNKAHGTRGRSEAEHAAKTSASDLTKTNGADSTTTPGIPNGQAHDLTETIKTLVHLAHENGHVTHDDINDVLPEGLSPEELDELHTKLRSLDVEIVDQAEA